MKKNESRQTNWLAYTSIVAAIPIIARLLITAFTKTIEIENIANQSDFIIFCLVLQIAVINELLRFNSPIFEKWRIKTIGICVLLLVFHAMIFAIVVLAESNPTLFRVDLLKLSAVVLAISTFYFSYSVHYRIINSA